MHASCCYVDEAAEAEESGIGIMQQVLKCSCPRGDQSPTNLVQHGNTMASSSHNHNNNSKINKSPPSPIQEAAECSVAGILYKWVNIGKGWRPRWFVLKHGVLSYYKVHGPHKITVSDEKHTASLIIGEESEKLIKRQRNIPRARKAFGELHLQVGSHSSIASMHLEHFHRITFTQLNFHDGKSRSGEPA